jgi:hypothetical protein
MGYCSDKTCPGYGERELSRICSYAALKSLDSAIGQLRNKFQAGDRMRLMQIAISIMEIASDKALRKYARRGAFVNLEPKGELERRKRMAKIEASARVRY